MKKRLFSLLLFLLILCSSTKTAFAEEEYISLEGEMGHAGYVNIFAYVSDDNNNQVNAIWFYHIDTDTKYLLKLNPYNFDEENLWIEQVNLPNGNYVINGGVFQDTKAKYSLYTENDHITVQDDTQTIICLIGTPKWLQKNKFSTDDLVNNEEEEDISDEIILPENTVPVITQTVSPTPTPIIYQAIEEEPQETEFKLSQAQLYSLIAAGLFFGFLLLKKLKKY